MNLRIKRPVFNKMKFLEKKDIRLILAKRYKIDVTNETRFTYFRVILPYENIEISASILQLWREESIQPKLKDYVCYNNVETQAFKIILHMAKQEKLKVIKHFFGQDLVEAALDIQGNRGLDNFILSMDRNIDEYFKPKRKGLECMDDDALEQFYKFFANDNDNNEEAMDEEDINNEEVMAEEDNNEETNKDKEKDNNEEEKNAKRFHSQNQTKRK